MASLKIVSDRMDDNSVKFAVVVPPTRIGAVNFGAVESVNRALLSVNPEAYDPVPIAPEHHATEAPMPPSLAQLLEAAESDEGPDGLKAGEAYREHAP